MRNACVLIEVVSSIYVFICSICIYFYLSTIHRYSVLSTYICFKVVIDKTRGLFK